MVGENSVKSTIFQIINNVVMFLLCLIALYPVVHVVFASMSGSYEIMSHQGFLLSPKGFTLAAYKMVFKNPMILRGYGNTLFVVIVGLMINITMTSIGAYFLSRKNVYFKKIINFLIVFTMFFSGGLIPFYFTVRDLGLYNSLWALVLPNAINTFNLIIMRTSFEGIPDSIEESAKLDGAGHFRILVGMILPLSLPVVAVMVLYYGVAHWNAWFYAMIFLQDRQLYPLQLILREILLQNETLSMTAGVGAVDQEAAGETVKYAVIVVTMLPIVMVYPFLQKYFVKGLMIGAVKG